MLRDSGARLEEVCWYNQTLSSLGVVARWPRPVYEVPAMERELHGMTVRTCRSGRKK